MKIRQLFAAVVIAFAIAVPVFTSSHAHAASGTCQPVSLQAALAAGQPKTQTISGTLCRPDMPSIGMSVDVLVHGATYNRTYWDFPVNQPQYSYVERTLQQGRAVFYYDRLGNGTSSRPLSALVSAQADAYILHQILGWLRVNHAYQDISLIGHSFGSIVAVQESAAYNDADRLVLTGMAHGTNLSGFLNATGAFYPAALDSQFAGKVLDPGYLTTVPGVRQDKFYGGVTDPAVMAYDEAHKDVVSFPSTLDSVVQFDSPAALNISQHITLPVFVQVGQLDQLFCTGLTHLDCSSSATMQANESVYFANAANVTANVVPNTGHSLALHPSAGQSFATINQWIESH